MPEPTSTVGLVVGAVAVPMLTIFGVSLGLRTDELIAGFAGALAAIALLDSVPRADDTFGELWRSSVRRVGVALASAFTAGYLVPLVGLLAHVPAPLELSLAFVSGAGAQRFLKAIIERGARKVEEA
jgi:hypothetical protein